MILRPHRAHAHKQMPCTPPSNDLKTRCFYAHLLKHHQHEQKEPYRAPLSIPPRQPDNVQHCKNHDWCRSPKPESSTEGLMVIVTWCECLFNYHDCKQLALRREGRAAMCKHTKAKTLAGLNTAQQISCLSSYITIWSLGWQMV